MAENVTATVATTVGTKFDKGKPDMTDIPLEAMWAMGEAFSYGQKKYGKNNYRQGMKVSRQLAAAIRHIYQHLDGQTLDKESGVAHLGHALASLAMACYTIKNHPGMDDRYAADTDKHGDLASSTESVRPASLRPTLEYIIMEDGKKTFL